MKFYETDFWFITKLLMTGFVRLSYGDPSVLVTGHLLQSSSPRCVEVRQLCMRSAVKQQLIDCKT